MRRDSQDVDPPRTELKDEEHVDPAQQHRIYREEVTCQQHAAAGDWTTYAAHYSRRANTSTASREQPQTAPHLKQTQTV
jgi:hypothetical protein